MPNGKHGCCADKACNDRTCMELPAGKTCGDCGHFRHCAAFYAHKATDTYCDFYPRRFVGRAPMPAGVTPCGAPLPYDRAAVETIAQKYGVTGPWATLHPFAREILAAHGHGVKEVGCG